MDKLNAILQNLKELEVAPPQSLYGQIRHSIQASASIEERHTGISQLYHYEVAPPTNAFAGIMKAFKEGDIKGRVVSISEKNSKRNIYRLYGAVAATFLALVAAWFIYRYPSKPSSNQQEIITQKTTEPAIILPDSNSNTTTRNIANNKKRTTTSLVEEFSLLPFSVNGTTFAVQDNDLLATFASYTHYRQVPEFLKDESEQSIKIQVDDYSSLTVSSGARKLMRNMYETRKNGKATAKARKAKRKINRWQKADQSKFDRTLEKNPIDPIDMADFIF